MGFDEYIRKPFVVDALEITLENITQVAEFVGVIGTSDDGTPYILVDPRKVPHLNRVHVGFYLTSMDGHLRCWSRRVFEDQFVTATPGRKTMCAKLGGSLDSVSQAGPQIVIHPPSQE